MLQYPSICLQLNQPILRQGIRGNSMSSLRRPNLSHIDLRVKHIIKIIVICEIHRMIFDGGELIYDSSSSCDGIIVNELSPEVSHCILLFCKNGLRQIPHCCLACHFDVSYWFILIFNYPGLPNIWDHVRQLDLSNYPSTHIWGLSIYYTKCSFVLFHSFQGLGPVPWIEIWHNFWFLMGFLHILLMVHTVDLGEINICVRSHAPNPFEVLDVIYYAM